MKTIPTIKHVGLCSLSAIAMALGLTGCDISGLDGEENVPTSALQRSDTDQRADQSPDTKKRYLDRDGSGATEDTKAPTYIVPEGTRPLLPDEDGYTGRTPTTSEPVTTNSQNARTK